jgi:hypothetical protein
VQIAAFLLPFCLFDNNIVPVDIVQAWRDQQVGRKLLRKTLEKLYDHECPESYCYNIKFVRNDAASTVNNSPLYALYSALRATPPSDPNWLEIHKSYFEEFIEMVVLDVTNIHLMLCTFMPSNLKHDDPVCKGWSSSLASLREEWRRRYETLAQSVFKDGNQLSESYYNFLHASSEDSFFITDLGDLGSETDVWNNCERVLVLVFMHFIDLVARLDAQTSARGQGRRDAADKQRQALDIVRKYTPASVRAACLIRSQRWEEAVMVLDQADASLDACMLAVINDVWGLTPRYERKDGLSVGVGAYVIKAFLSPSFPLLPASYLNWQPPSFRDLCPHASIYVFVTMALCLDAGVSNRLQAKYIHDSSESEDAMGAASDEPQTKKALISSSNKNLTAGSALTQQLIGWLLLHVFDSADCPRDTRAAREHVISNLLVPILNQVGLPLPNSSGGCGFDDQFKFDYLHGIWKCCAGHLDIISRHKPIFLIEAAEAHLLCVQFDKWAECIMKALTFCIPEPSMCIPDSSPLLVPPSFFTQDRRAALQTITDHLTGIFSVDALDQAPPLNPVFGADILLHSKEELFRKLNEYTHTPGSDSWFKSASFRSQQVEFANPKLQYIFQMLAVARAFLAHASGLQADDVLDIITGRPKIFNSGGEFNKVAKSSDLGDGAEWPSFLLPVTVCSYKDDSYFFTQREQEQYTSLS